MGAARQPVVAGQMLVPSTVEVGEKIPSVTFSVARSAVYFCICKSPGILTHRLFLKKKKKKIKKHPVSVSSSQEKNVSTETV